ncbi:MAG: ADP-ribosylglycohydrolase family protein [Candidatus Lokiarchaeota archaeon]|nr:ADP-ribosylglycohydrolase family protein [Candidatus Lokiarchaeota archaeon]
MKELTSEEYYNKVYGSWLGRVAGDFVGVPVELKSYKNIKVKYGNITNFPEPIDLNHVNDDEMYEIIALIALEKYGIDITAEKIALEWVNLLKREDYVFTAEKIALNNLKAGIQPPHSGIVNNFYFDFIGAQMRADIWGLITPGCPNLAKNYAEIDGSISHAGIGIEGEVFIAVLISQVFFEEDIRHNIDTALQYLPSEKESLYTQMVKKAVNIYELYPNDFRVARKILIREFWKKEMVEKVLNSSSVFPIERRIFLNTRLGGVHVLPNIGLIILALLYGAQDKQDPFGKSICIAAMMGYDTDCNCGNIGAILGARLGADNIPAKWKEPLQDTFSTYVKGYDKWKISELSRRVANVGQSVIQKKCKNGVKLVK